jgi:hypothetical protein
MKKQTKKPARSKFTLLAQICNIIPSHLVSKIARQTGVQSKSRTYSPWSHVLTMIYAQLTRSIGLNDVCDSLRIHQTELSRIRGAKPPSRNTLSHANKERSASMAETLFWELLKHLESSYGVFGKGRTPGPLKKFRRAIHIIDSTTIELVAQCMDWAKHRRRKAAAKTHMRLDLESLLPRFAIVDIAKENDNLRARELCAGLKDGEICIFDRAYNDFDHLKHLHERGIWWVGREKKGTVYDLLESRPTQGNILEDQMVMLNKDVLARRIRACVVVDGQEREMTFLTNHLHWSARTICDLYKARWQIEVFFKQIKQTLKLGDFLGHSANAVRWQVWSALITYLLLRFMAAMGKWSHSFTRLYTVIRAGLWRRLNLWKLLDEFYGTAGGHFRNLAQPQQAYFPGFETT